MPIYLGIDPGLASTGWGVIESQRGRLRAVDYGVIRTPSDEPPGERLARIYRELTAVSASAKPIAAGIESLFFARNITSALPVAQARGVILLCLAHAGIPAEEYAPQVIKQAVVGTGQADKQQVQEMVRVILGLTERPRPDHAADALAAAVTRCHSRP